MILFYLIVMFVLYDAMQKTRDFDNMSSNNVRGDISRAGIIFLKGLQLRVLLECGFYSREGIIWGNTVLEAGNFYKIVWRRNLLVYILHTTAHMSVRAEVDSGFVGFTTWVVSLIVKTSQNLCSNMIQHCTLKQKYIGNTNFSITMTLWNWWSDKTLMQTGTVKPLSIWRYFPQK